MNTKFILLLLILIAAGELQAARSSSRNFKSLKQREVEKVEAAKAAKLEKEEASKYADFNPGAKPVEKVTFLGPKNGWGFVKKASVYYSPGGKNLGELKAGTLFKYQDVKSSSKNDMLLSSLRDGSGWHGPYLLPCTEVAAYEGDPETVDIEIVADLRSYFLLKGEHDQYREEILIREYKKNPHYEAYRQAAEQYNATIEKARIMDEEASELSGIKKTRAHEELRKLKYSQAELKVNLQKIGAKYKAWKKQHPVDVEKVQDEKLLVMQDKIAAIKTRISDLIPEE